MFENLKHKPKGVLLCSLGFASLVLAGLAARKLMLQQRGAGALPVAPLPNADDARRSMDTYSVAGEEDPGAAVDAPAPPTTSPPLSQTWKQDATMPTRTDTQPHATTPLKKKPSSPANMVSRTPRAPGSMPAEEAEEHLQLPHERDENAVMTGGEQRPVIQQAAKDLERGLVDTDMRATPGLDARQRERDVPGAGGRPPQENDVDHPDHAGHGVESESKHQQGRRRR